MAAPSLRIVAVNETPSALIEIAGVAKTYRSRDGEVPSLRPLDLAVHNGEFLVIVGPSGCGRRRS
jgi:NitT/TauT family transport system ATP-binding protein